MQFLYCIKCDKVYFVHESAVPGSFLEWLEFQVEIDKGDEEQREICVANHNIKILDVINSYIVNGMEIDLLKTIIYVVKDEDGILMAIVKKRRSLETSPEYKLYGHLGELPMSLPDRLYRFA